MTAPTTLADDLEVAPAPQVPATLFRGLSIAQVDAYETRIETATRSALRRVMRQVTANLGETTTAAAMVLVADAASISPDDLSGIGPLWHAQVEQQLQPVVAQVYRDAGATLHSSMVEAVGDLPRVSSVAAETYLAQSATTFDAIGAQLWETARSELIAGMAAGEDIPTLAARLRTTVPDLTARQATLVARTQVNDAANAGSYATAQASGLDLVKGWESTADLRTRETHLFAGSRYSGPGMIPLAENFMVGGWACERPHDLELPPGERYNCRCTLVYGMRDAPPPPRDQFVAQLEAEHRRRLDALALRHRERLERLRVAHEAKLAVLAERAEERAAAIAAARLAYEQRVAGLRVEYEARRAALTAEHQRRLAIARGEEPPTPLSMAAAPGVEPVIPVAGQPTLVPVRAALAEAQTVPQVRQAFIAEWDRIIAGQPGAVRGSVRFSPTADVQTAREHAEGLLRGLERFPAVRMDVTSGGISAYAQTAGREIKFATSWGRQRDNYLASLRRDGARNAEGIAFHPVTIQSPQGVAVHEFGHVLEYALSLDVQGVYDLDMQWQAMRKVKRIVAELANERGIPTTELVKLEIGEYAAGSTQELLAEAFADAMINGDAASELSRRIFVMLVREYERVAPPRAGGLGGVVEPLATRAAPLVDDGLDVLELHSLRSLATEFEITNASRLGRERLIRELRQRGAMSPEARRAAELAQVQGRAIAETLGMLDAGTDLATIVESLVGRAELKDLLAIVRRAKDPDKLATSLKGFATRRNIVIPTKTQLKALQAAERKAAAAAKREAALAVRAEKARQAEIKAQVKAVHAGDFRSLAQTDTGAYQASDGSLWTVESFASEREARERVLAMALRDLVEPGPGGPQPLAVAGRGAPGPGGWQVAYVGAVPRTAVTLDDWLASASLNQLKAVTPARLRALVAKVGLGPDDAERLIARRGDAVLREQLLAKRFRSRSAPLLTDLKALAAEPNPGRFINGPYGSMGLRARVTSFNVDVNARAPGSYGEALRTKGDVLRGGRKVGTFSRDYYFDNGELVAHHGYLEIAADVRGSGFAEEFNANLIDWYRRSGIKEVRLTANIDVGGYAWARAGYDFANANAAGEIERLLSRVTVDLTAGANRQLYAPFTDAVDTLLAQMSPDEVAAQIRAAQALLARARRYRFGDPQYPSAYEFSQVGRHAGQGKDDMWIGKAAMLGSYWKAVLYL